MATKNVKRKNTTIAKHISTRKAKPGISTNGRLISVLNLVRITRNEAYLPADYKKVMDYVRKGDRTSVDLVKSNPLKLKEKTPSLLRQAYYRRLTKLMEVGLLEKHYESFYNDNTRSGVKLCVYTPIEFEPVKLGPGQCLDIQIRLLS